MITVDEIKDAAERLAAAASSPASVILFGSHAQGTAREDSDVDFLVVEESLPSQLQEYGRLRRAILATLDASVDILVVSREHADAWKDVRGTIIHEAYARGRVLVRE